MLKLENPKLEFEDCKGLLGTVGDRESEGDGLGFNEAHFNVNANMVALTNSLGSGSTLSFSGEEAKKQLEDAQGASIAIQRYDETIIEE